MGAIQSTNTAPQEWASLNAWMEATPLFLEQTLNYITTLGDTYSSESADEPQPTQEAEPAADAQLEASAEEAKPADEPQPSPEGKGAADAIPEKSTKDNEKRLSENFPRMHMLYDIKPMEQLEKNVRDLTKELLRHGFQRGAKFQQAHMSIAQFVALAYLDIKDGMVAAKRLYERVILLVSKYMDTDKYMDQFSEFLAEGLERECPQLCQHILTTTGYPPEVLASIVQGSTARLLIDRGNPDRTWHLIMQLLDLSYAQQHHTEEEISHQVFELVVDATTRMLVSMTDRIVAYGNEDCILSALASMVEWEGPWVADDQFRSIIEAITNHPEEFGENRLSRGSQASTNVSSGPSDDDMTDEDDLDFKNLPSLEAFHVPMDTLPDFTAMRNQYLLSIKECSYIVVVFGTEDQKKDALQCLQSQCTGEVVVVHRRETWALVEVLGKQGFVQDATTKTFVRWRAGMARKKEESRKKEEIEPKQLENLRKFAFRKGLADGAWISPSRLFATHQSEGLLDLIASEKHNLDISLPITDKDAFEAYVDQFHRGKNEEIGVLVKRVVLGLSHRGRHALLRVFHDIAKLAPTKVATALKNTKLKVEAKGKRKQRLLDIFASPGTSRNFFREEHATFFQNLVGEVHSLEEPLRLALLRLGAWNVAFSCCTGDAGTAIFSKDMLGFVRISSWSSDFIVDDCVKECMNLLSLGGQDQGGNLPAKAVINRRSLPRGCTPAEYAQQIGKDIGCTPKETLGVTPHVDHGSLVITLDNFDEKSIMDSWLNKKLPVRDPQGYEVLAVIPGRLGHELTKRNFFDQPSDQPGLHVVTDKIKACDLRGITGNSKAVLNFVKEEAEGAGQARGSTVYEPPQIAATKGASVHTWITWHSANVTFVEELKERLLTDAAKQRFKDKYNLQIKEVEAFANLAKSCQDFDAAHPASDVAHTPKAKKTRAEPAGSEKQAVHTISHDSKRQKKM